MPHPKITAAIETITPALAEKYLSNMVLNRKPRETTIIMYANDMKNDKWLLSPQGIAFDESNRLIDGQHRLKAIIRAAIPIELLVIRGFPTSQKSMKTMDVLDAGAVRTIGDRLRLMGTYHTNPNLTSAIARQIAGFVMGANSRSIRKLSIAAVLEITRLWKAEIQAVCSIVDRPNYRPARNAHIAAAFVIAAGADVTRTDHDMGRFLSGAGLEPDSPLLHWRNTLFSPTVITAEDPRPKTLLTLSALYASWNDFPSKSYLAPATYEKAIAHFRSAQARRCAQVEKIFNQQPQAKP
jgi:hypothetical protein